MLDAAALLAWPPAARRRRELQPLLYGLLEAEGRLGALAADERTFARAAYVNTRARSVLLRETLLEVAAVAATEGVPILPLKGALLAFTAYPDPGLRPMGDLDLAVRPADAEPLAAALAARGFRRHGEGRARFDLAVSHHLVLRRPGAPPVELHARLVHELAIDGAVEPLFQRAQPLRLFGHPFAIPPWDEHVVYLALHAATHGFADSPLWVADLAFVAPLVAPDADLPGIAAARRGRSAAHFAFALARRYLPGLALTAPPPRGAALRGALLARALGPDPLAAPSRFFASHLARAALTDDPLALGRNLLGKLALRLEERFREGVRDPPWR